MGNLLDKHHNFIAEKSVTADDSSLRSIGERATRALALMEKIAGLEEEIKARKEELRLLQSEDLPAAMLNAGTSAFNTLDGYRLERGTKIEGAIPKGAAGRAKALATLFELGAQDLIKTSLTINFEREARNNAMALATALTSKGYEPHLDSEVHHMTLKAWARERIEAGLKVPADLLGLWIGDWVDIKRAK